MKSFNVALLIFILAAGTAYLTKPSDAQCLRRGRALVDEARVAIPGYDNPMAVNAQGPVPAEDVFVTDHFFWKEIDYIHEGFRRPIAYAWLGGVHPIRNHKN